MKAKEDDSLADLEKNLKGEKDPTKALSNAVKDKKNKILNRLVKGLLKCEDRPFF